VTVAVSVAFCPNADGLTFDTSAVAEAALTTPSNAAELVADPQAFVKTAR
jgi:hypothetical protein